MVSSNAPLEKKTVQFAHHQVPLECDIYDAPDYPTNSPVLLFFHSGGLVGGSRSMVPPWLVQTCHRRKWPLVSPSYRLLPQASGRDLLQDARAAYAFAQSHNTAALGLRPVILSGASAGFLLPAFLSHHPDASPPPLALLSISGIPTVHNPFFTSSHLIPPDPIPEDDVASYLSEPLTASRHPWDRAAVFHLSSLLPSGGRDAAFDAARAPLLAGDDGDPERGMLYDYFVYEGLFPDLIGEREVDVGFDAVEVEKWPMTVMIQGDADDDLDPGVCRDVAGKLGGRAVVFVAEGKGHLFERSKFLEEVEGEEGLVAVRRAIEALDGVVRGVLGAHWNSPFLDG